MPLLFSHFIFQKKLCGLLNADAKIATVSRELDAKIATEQEQLARLAALKTSRTQDNCFFTLECTDAKFAVSQTLKLLRAQGNCTFIFECTDAKFVVSKKKKIKII